MNRTMILPTLTNIFYVLMFGFSLSDTSTDYSRITGCHNGWIAYEGYCYLFSSTAIRFVEAEHYCQQHGGHVVEVFSSKENAFIKDQLKGLNRYYPIRFSPQEIPDIHSLHQMAIQLGYRNGCMTDKTVAKLSKQQLVFRLARCAWIGLTDERTEGSWRWLNSQNLNFTDWYPGETVHDNEDCAVFWNGHGYRWEDAPCTFDCLPLCKQRGVVELPDIVG